jgi:hypothetical protein
VSLDKHRTTKRWLAGLALILLLTAPCLTAGAAPGKGLEDLAGPLRTLAAQAGQGQVNTAAVSARSLGLITVGEAVAVQINFKSAAAAAGADLTPFGGRVQYRRDTRMQALIPIARLAEVAAQPQVALVEPLTELIPAQGFGAVRSQGVQLTNATAMHLAGRTGAGAKVAILDLGFAGVTAGEVPVTIGAGSSSILSFRADGSTTASNHGTAVAEVVADMAPGCTMTLVAVDSSLSIEQAIDQLIIPQRFHVVVMALGLLEGPFDGTHSLSRAVNRARNAGVFWANAAGNFAQRHWSDTWRDVQRDGFLDFTGTKDRINLDLAAGAFTATLSWFETAGALTGRDYDLVLVDSTGREIARSAYTQNGDDPPRDQLLAYIGTAGTYGLKIQRMSAGADVADRFKLFVPGVDIEAQLRHPDNSLAIPAEATGAFAVGATRGSDLITAGPLAGIVIDALEPFSSRGPVGSTTKPDLVAPDAVSTSLPVATNPTDASVNPFVGTSCAVAHVGGAAALLYGEDPSRTPAVLAQLLVRLALLPPNIPVAERNGWGAGRLSLRVGADADGDAPLVAIAFPRTNSTITVASPIVQASITDAGGVRLTSIQVWLDNIPLVANGVLVPGTKAFRYEYDVDSGVLRLWLDNLTRTRHTLAVQATDLAGNVSDLAISNFRISTPSIPAGLHIISLPYPDLVNQDPSEVFGVPTNGAPSEVMTLLRWVPTDSRYSKYHIYPDDFAGFSPPDGLVPKPPAGLGYFLSLPVQATLNIAAGGLTDPTYPIQLVYGNDPPRGWNLIGNPYDDYVDWGSVEFISSNGRQDLREAMDPTKNPVTEGVLFEFVSGAGGGYYSFPADPTEATMAPLKGYWLHVLKDATLVVYNPGNVGTASRAKSQTASKTSVASNPGEGWLLKLEARSGKYEDPVNYIGVASRATDGYDLGLDVKEPPPVVDVLRMYVTQRDWGPHAGAYAKDVRGSLNGRQTWDVEVSCRLTNQPVTISWPNLGETVPRDVDLRLEDLDSGTTIYMRTSTGYTFTPTQPGVRRLRIVASKETGPLLAVNGVSTQMARGGQVMFTYAVTRAADVSIEIRNISGVLIRTLGVQSAAPGAAATAVWNRQNEHGAQAPSGKYIARLTARTADGQTVQAIQPFHLTR